MRSSKFLSFVLGILSACGLALSAEATQYVIGESTSWIDLSDKDYVKLENCSAENNGENIGSTHGNTVMTVSLKNNAKGDYYLSWKGGASGLTATNCVSVYNASGYQVTGICEQPNTGSWSPKTPHGFLLTNLPEGDLTLKFYIVSTTGSYAGNYGDFTFTAYTDKKTVTPATVSHATATATVDGCSVSGSSMPPFAVTNGAAAVVTYVPEPSYVLSGTTVFTYESVTADVAIDASLAPTAAAMPWYESGTITRTTTSANTTEVHVAGDANNVSGTIIVNSGTYTFDDYLAVACGQGNTGSFTVNGGSLSIAKALYVTRHASGGGLNSTGSFTLNDGTVTVGNGFYTGWNAGSVAYVSQNGGTITVTGNYEPSYGGGSTNYTVIAGGLFDVSSDLKLTIYGNSLADVTISGGELKVGGTVIFYNRTDAQTAVARMKLTGGVLTAKKLQAGTTVQTTPASFLLDGGTLRASAANTTDFIKSDTTLAVELKSGTIDTQSFDVKIPADIVGDALAFTKTGAGTLTFTSSTIPSGTITVAYDGGSVVIPSAASVTAGVNTKVVDDGTNKTFTYEPPKYTVKAPAVDHTTVSVATNDIAISSSSDTYTVESNSTVAVTYTITDTDYTLDGATTKTFTIANIASDQTITAPTAKLKQFTITVPEVANTTVKVTSGSETLGTTNGVYAVDIHTSVTVTYTAKENYVFEDGATTKTFSYTDISEGKEVSLGVPVRQFSVTVPVVEHATATVTGATEKVSAETAAIYSAASNATVTVTYTAAVHYTLSSDATTNIVGIAADATITAPTAILDAQWMEGTVTTNSENQVHLAEATGSTAEWVINRGDYSVANVLALACGSNAKAYLTLNGGSLTVPTTLYAVKHSGGGGSWSEAYITISNATLTAGAYEVGHAGPSVVYMDILNGGTFAVNGDCRLSLGGGNTNFIHIAEGGVFTASSGIEMCNYCDNASYDSGTIITMDGGSLTAGGAINFRNRNDGHGCPQRITVKGGVLTATTLYTKYGNSDYGDAFELNGGTLRAPSKQAKFLDNDSTHFLAFYLTSGTIDTQTYDVTIPAAISGTSMAFTKTGTGTLTFTGTIPSSGTITIAKKGGKVVLPGNVTSWVGEKTAATYDETAKTTTFSYDATMRTVTVPTLAGATIVVTADGTAVTAESDGKSYKVEDGATVVVTYTEASGYTLVGGKKVVSLGTISEDTAIPTDSIPKTIADRTFNGDYVTETITGAGRIYTYGNHDAQPQIYTTLDCDLTGFTGTIYVKKDTKIGPNFKGAAQAKWVLEGELYLFGTNLEHTVDTAYAGTISFGDFGLSAMNRIYMYGGTQDLTIEIGAVNSNMTATLNSGIGGDWWSHTPNDNASVTMKKVGTGKLTTNLLGARKWNIAAGEVNFVPMTSEAIAGEKRMYVTNCNEMVVASGAKLSGFYGSLPDSGVGAFTLEKLTVPSGATFAPDLGRTWIVGTATLDGCNLELTDTGKLTYGIKYTLLTATTSISAANITLTGSKDFTVAVEDKSLVATFTGNGQCVIKSGETLTYAGQVKDETKHMDTDLGIVIEAGGKLVVNARAMTLPGTDGTEGNDGTLTLPSVTLPTGKTIEDCVTVIPPAGYHGVYFVASDGYGYITFEVGEIKPAGLIIIFQ